MCRKMFAVEFDQIEKGDIEEYPMGVAQVNEVANGCAFSNDDECGCLTNRETDKTTDEHRSKLILMLCLGFIPGW